jgi:hypothetical protein
LCVNKSQFVPVIFEPPCIKIKIYRNIIVPVVLYGCGTSSFERSIFRLQRDEVTREWRRLHKKQLYVLYNLPNIIRVIKSRRLRWADHVARMREMRGACRFWVGKREGMRHFEDPG